MNLLDQQMRDISQGYWCCTLCFRVDTMLSSISDIPEGMQIHMTSSFLLGGDSIKHDCAILFQQWEFQNECLILGKNLKVKNSPFYK
jgi:hypothetical protein